MPQTSNQSPHPAETSALATFLDKYLKRVPQSGLGGLLLIQVDQNNRIGTSFGRKYTRRFCQHYAAKLRAYLPKGSVIVELPERRFAIVVIRSMVTDVIDLGTSIIERIEPRMQIAAEKFSVDVQMGIALYPTHAEDGDTLFRRAELALKQAKESGLRFEVYEPDSSGFQKALWKFETELKQAIRFGQLEVYFQPKYSLEQGRVCGAEALVRWRNQIGQLLPAADFIPAAERSGAIVPLTWLVMEQVTKLASSFSAAPRPFSIAVNVPAQALADREFFQRLTTVKIELERHQISLVIELTEDSLMQTDSASLEVLNRIRERGVGLAIDDFGKGYSSLNYLRQIPATELKIDREFIRAVALNEKDRHIVKTAIELANAFDMQSVAEGVDSDECVYVLKQLGCSSIQGYFLARPMGVKALQEWFRTKTFDYLHRAATRNAMNISL